MEPFDESGRKPLDMDSCEHGGHIYPETAQVCPHQFCMMCIHGQWEELSYWPDEDEEEGSIY